MIFYNLNVKRYLDISIPLQAKGRHPLLTQKVCKLAIPLTRYVAEFCRLCKVCYNSVLALDAIVLSGLLRCWLRRNIPQ